MLSRRMLELAESNFDRKLRGAHSTSSIPRFAWTCAGAAEDWVALMALRIASNSCDDTTNIKLDIETEIKQDFGYGPYLEL